MKVSSKSFFLLLQFLLLFIFFINCASNTQQVEQVNTPKTETVQYLALGDSYTIGTSINPQNSYPYQLADSLRTNGMSIDTTQIIARNGWTTTDLKRGIQEAKPDSNFDLVSLLIGVNNQYQGKNIELYKTEFRALIEQAIAFAGGDAARVFVISIPNYGVTPFAASGNPENIRTELARYDTIAKEISLHYNIPFIDITPISELAATDTSLLASDQLHPSAKMYSLWIGEMLPTVTQIISE